MARILIVEDEIKIARFVELELKHEGYEVKAVHDGTQGSEEIIKEDYDLAVLDVMLPGMSGFEICAKAREAGVKIPIIMLTAKDDVTDKLSGFDKGADDYMTKPFAIEELLARIKVHLSRAKAGEEKKVKTLEYGKLKLNITSHTAYYGDDELTLTKKEYELLEYLLKNKDTALSRDNILNVVWGYEYFGDTNVVDVYVRYLRQKIDDKYGVKIIGTVRGIGYIIRSEE
ncbi:MAG: response regulator transcription factor [Lachnospiraceae bacterium]|nr:response regulator transcription factor [Lachnospiraceae bacterium]